MPQEFQVLQCYNCNVFQVEIVKKKPKWECKICHEKQSVKQIFLRGASKDCRLLVQDCNEKRLALNEAPKFTNAIFTPTRGHTVESCTSKWSDFIPRKGDPQDSEIGQVTMGDYTFERPTKRRKTSKESENQMEAEFNESGSSSDHAISMLQHTTDEDRPGSSNASCQFASSSVVSNSFEQYTLKHQHKVRELDKSQENYCNEYHLARKDTYQSNANSNFQNQNPSRHDTPRRGLSARSHHIFEEDNFELSDDFLF